MRDAAGEHAHRLELRGPHQFGLQPLPLRDVAEHQHGADQTAVGGMDRRTTALEMAHGAARPRQHRARRQVDHDVGRQHRAHRQRRRQTALGQLQREHLRERLPHHVLAVSLEQRQRGRIGVEHPPLRVGRDHPLGDRPQRDREPLLLRRQRRLRPLEAGHIDHDADQRAAVGGGAHDRSAFIQPIHGALDPGPKLLLVARRPRTNRLGAAALHRRIFVHSGLVPVQGRGRIGLGRTEELVEQRRTGHVHSPNLVPIGPQLDLGPPQQALDHLEEFLELPLPGPALLLQLPLAGHIGDHTHQAPLAHPVGFDRDLLV